VPNSLDATAHWPTPKSWAKPNFSGRVGAGLDACSAIQVAVNLAAKEQQEVNFSGLERQKIQTKPVTWLPVSGEALLHSNL